MILEICTKNGALVRELVIDSPVVPRVGEVVVSPADVDALQGISTLLVVDVQHHVIGNALSTVVRCVARGEPSALRLAELQEAGWVPACS